MGDLKKREAQLKQKEELADGLHLIDFEQLKIENQTYNEKIEERNEELLKLRKKITTTVQIQIPGIFPTIIAEYPKPKTFSVFKTHKFSKFKPTIWSASTTTLYQVLTHVKEKLQFVQGENAGQREKLKVVEFEVAKKRDILSRTKQARDALRIDNVKQRKKCGLIGQESLLRDLEVRKDDSESLTTSIENLQRHHMDLLMQVDGVRQKVDAVKVHSM
eukprot:sb/3469939/